ncbi:hypothetical protein FE783_26575 [Paenibacillus mesophilus]|uniref:hypothetical protein n=1 Tax=Paenibacillus mesophilus TaxID=2582849 RepID=UPI00110ED809|nr:hypothetical protein [Paenibacillus mesophilus]TMV46258.1 hypothetical protein FE783_26575 [Paenibacillus mesophilus]
MKLYALFIAVIVLLAVTGCGRLDLVVQEDSSGEGNYSVDLMGKISAQQIKAEMEKQIQKANKKAGKEIITLNKFEEKDGKVNATVIFGNISALGGDDSLLVTVDDLNRIYPEPIRKLTDVKRQTVITPEAIEKIGDKPAIYLDMDEDVEITVTVPGNILYAAGGTVSDQKPRTLLASGDSVVIVYEPSGRSDIVWTVMLLVAAVVLYFLYRNGLFKKILSGRKGGGIPNAQ